MSWTDYGKRYIYRRPTSTLRLPNEIILSIVGLITSDDDNPYRPTDGRKTVANLRLTSRQLHNLASARLFSTIKLHNKGLAATKEQVNGILSSPRNLVELYVRGVEFSNSSIWYTDDINMYGHWYKKRADDKLDEGKNGVADLFSLAGEFRELLWRLVERCDGRLAAIRHCGNFRAGHTDYFIPIVFQMLESFELPRLKCVEIQASDMANIGDLAGHVTWENKGFAGWNMVQLKRNLGRVTDLRMGTQMPYTDAATFWRGVYVDEFQKFGENVLSCMEGVESLSLMRLTPALLHQFGGHAKLSMLSIHDTHGVNGGELVAVLKGSPKLQMLELVRVTLSGSVAGGTVWWKDVFAQCADDMASLESFHFQELGYVSLGGGGNLHSALHPVVNIRMGGLGWKGVPVLSSPHMDDQEELVRLRDWVTRTRAVRKRHDYDFYMKLVDGVTRKAV